MQHLLWTYYAPEEVVLAVEHIDVLVECGVDPDRAAHDAARIYRQRNGDHRTPFVREYLASQWRVMRRGGPGPLPSHTKGGWKPKPSKYPTEVSFRASFHRLFYE
ncbi:MAG TPA: hypothetical protein VMY41_01185 [Thermohalobaculum sp.]|nr:hypothetical protein [Thermohalobaculum sp.]